MAVPFLDLTRQHSEVGAELAEATRRVMSGGVYVLGPEVEAFEEEWARFCGARASAAVGNGTDALTLALLASGAMRPGRRDEVITPTLSSAYTALAITNAGGVPVFADIDERTLTLDPNRLEAAITERTRAVVPVHLYGRMADMHAIRRVASRHHLVVIEDAAQAHGARLGDKSAGAHGHAAAFSFYPTKNLGAFGDGGAVTSNDAELIARVKTLRQGGHEDALGGKLVGRNSRLDELQAALLRVKLRYLEPWNSRRRALADIYDEVLGASESVRLPFNGEPESHAYHLYVIRHPRREALRADLAARGIQTLVHYPCLLHQQPLFRRERQQTLPAAERAAPTLLSLPLYPQLDDDEVREVARHVLLLTAE